MVEPDVRPLPPLFVQALQAPPVYLLVSTLYLSIEAPPLLPAVQDNVKLPSGLIEVGLADMLAT